TTDSGRFSCSDPNLQQVPSTHTAPGFRACFRASPGHRLIVADYAQVELRVAAQVAPCDEMRRVFLEGRDPHRTTAATLTGKAEAEISDRERKLAKAINFGFLFGMGPRRFQSYAEASYDIALTSDEARAARAAFLRTYPGIDAWHQRTAALPRRTRDGRIYVATRLGRQRGFEVDDFSFTTALNIPVQGTAAEGFKLAMMRLHERLPALQSRGLLCVHDEYIAEAPASKAEEVRELVISEMIAGMKEVTPDVPIEVEATVCDHWEEA
ncbi:MAG: DNA polymerase, partial [Nannocystaceae bacterium]